MKKCIVYFPFKIHEEHPSASNLRPIKIVKGFKELGYEVEVIKGYAAERKNTIKKLENKIENGEKFDFIYMESSTEPTLLTESHHIPIHPFFDFKFLKFCRKRGIKVGLFYRDIHWRFSQYKNTVSTPKRAIAYTFYYYDLLKYKSSIDVLYLPSLRMEKYIPIKLNKPILELPSGCEFIEATGQLDISKDKFSILYVGGLNRELYNIEEMVKAVANNERFTLTICCRQEEWEANKGYYYEYLNDRIKIIHESGNELDKIAISADMFSLIVEPTSYWEFAIPMKLFSYISYGKPILGVSNTACGEFIEKNNIGYTTKYNEENIKNILKYVEKNYSKDYDRMKLAMSEAFENNTWEKRAYAVVRSLHK